MCVDTIRGSFFDNSVRPALCCLHHVARGQQKTVTVSCGLAELRQRMLTEGQALLRVSARLPLHFVGFKTISANG